VVNGNGRLGIQASSARYKRDIRDMGDASDKLMKLRPVTFRYKDDPSGGLQYGLIAEEVAQVYPELVSYGEDGKVQSVAYHLLPAMLLNELQRQARENQQKDERIAELQHQIREQHKQIASQQRQLDDLRKQAAQIDALTARLNALEAQARTADDTQRLASAVR